MTCSIPKQHAFINEINEIAGEGLKRREMKEKWYQLIRASLGGPDRKHN